MGKANPMFFPQKMPFEDKVRRLRAGGKSEAEAIELAETVDRDRAAYIKQYFGVDWPTREYFDLMINTNMGDERVVETMLHSVALQPAGV